MKKFITVIHPDIKINGLTQEGEVFYKRYTYAPRLSIFITALYNAKGPASLHPFLVNFNDIVETSLNIENSNRNGEIINEKKDETYRSIGQTMSSLRIMALHCVGESFNNYDSIIKFSSLKSSIIGDEKSANNPLLGVARTKIMEACSSFNSLENLGRAILDRVSKYTDKYDDQLQRYTRLALIDRDCKFKECMYNLDNNHSTDYSQCLYDIGEIVYEYYLYLRNININIAHEAEIDYDDEIDHGLKQFYNILAAIYGPVALLGYANSKRDTGYSVTLSDHIITNATKPVTCYLYNKGLNLV